MDTDLPELAEILAAYGLRAHADAASTRAADVAPTAAAHSVATRVTERVWRVQTTTGNVAVKRYTLDQSARAEKEAALVAHLNKHPSPRFQVQALRRTRAGAERWVGPHACAMVTDWAPGASRTYDTYTPQEWAALGSSLAALHLSLEQYPRPLPDSLHARLDALDIDEIRGELATAAGMAQARADGASLRAYADACLRLIDQHYPGSLAGFPKDDPQCPIHNDYNQFNYLFGAVLPPLILDWEAAIGAPREYEVVRCLNHLPLEAPALAAHFVRAYVDVRPLRIERMAWAVDTAILQHGLKSWIVQGWQKEPARFEAHLQGSLHMAATLTGARSRLIDFFSGCIEKGSPRE
ncbi:phosphotransferase enzyme family protein [Bordetella sp. N]|uniref:phosphotransferase enzyme family protein n=1 Tax=Bordetella sp. N TaxID=1746199 RepID=UPI00070C784F|nr:phosphotransferase [Bordetella sp. N]ALM81617.1 aminoglycoside phosphotransferase [Bordetella sp. N]